MQPQGTALVNTEYFDNLIAEVNALDVCSELQGLVNEAFASLQAEVNACEAQIAALVPLLVIPTDLGSVIEWITNYIAGPALAYAHYAAQVAALIAKVGELTTAIENAAKRLEMCSITIPMISV